MTSTTLASVFGNRGLSLFSLLSATCKQSSPKDKRRSAASVAMLLSKNRYNYNLVWLLQGWGCWGQFIVHQSVATAGNMGAL